MKPTTPRRTRRLLARAATMNQAHDEFDDYGPEPNMKLSHAFLVVLLLHVVAVGGLYAFNTIKAGNRAGAKLEAKTRAVAEKTLPGGENGSISGGSGGAGDQGNDRPPLETKPAPVAKVSKPAREAESSENTAKHSKGLLASARGMLQKAGIGGAVAAGSTELAAQEPVPASVPQTAPAGVQTYTVKGGDTLTRIAATLGVPIPDLEKANALAGNSVLQVGQVLKVPAATAPQSATAAENTAPSTASPSPGAAPASTVSSTTPTPEAGATTGYTVVKGDNPWKIAKKFKISQDELMKANGITDPKKIQIGQVLRIPSPSPKTSKAGQ
jgi:LysM repeat protein